ncbi:KIR-like protein [Plasmodium knowlesi strain H]|uniref:KIR-like protein n=3 Tax=Plasmodium knowlesi TaxID=5850 RepID=A0A5K1U349_PLAKH|nr:KIR-like protein [Plasmodium knowlesi strain H]OTN68187.1 KIR-like protein [Plasmodium knowlesi]CAA9987284.1 KIR-like protein [Plasmodium knowlesi strain H]SBO24061.1 KIR-like protein [Plasmodium knowlesi strain H]SBO26092.1 KIR-like protein [Plasmodium knowlesi strain H]VVS76758.1 KIR-like protein [Plasmodium knowlesi strain H]|eukprot:XP_002261902.1 kir-like protein [Plasmodium knowlesi strain H]
MEEAITNPKLGALPSYKFYTKLINKENLNDAKNFCRDVLNRDASAQGLHKICTQLIKNVELVRDDSEDTFRKKHCFDINYWLHDEVYKELKSNNKESDFQNIIDLFEEIWKKFIVHSYDVKKDKDVCFPDKALFRENFLTYLKQMKNFMDYIENYNSIKVDIRNNTYYACQVYLDYLKERIPLYFSFEPLCTKIGLNTCTSYIQGYFSYDPRKFFTKYELLKLSFQLLWNPCYRKVADLLYDFQKSPTAFKERYNEYVQAFMNNPNHKKVNLAQRGEVKHSITAVNSEAATLPTVSDSKELAEFSSAVHSNDGISGFISAQIFSLSKVALYTIFSVLAITIVITVLWKFTSLGNLFSRRRKRIRRELQYNIYLPEGDSIFDSYNSSSTISDENEHSIAYGTM